MEIILYTMSMNIGLGVFNLIPLPPLDGSKVLLALLPSRAQDWYENNQHILYIIFLVIWITPIAGQIVTQEGQFGIRNTDTIDRLKGL